MVPFTQMIWVDFTILGLVGMYVLIGLIRGFNKEMLSLLSWILAIAASWSLAGEFSEFMQKGIPIDSSSVRIAASFISLLIIIRLLTSFILFLMTGGFRSKKISLLDHFSGMFVGAFHGAVNVVVLILLSGMTSLPKDSWWIQSQLIPPFQSLAVWLRDHIPSEMVGYIHFS